MALRPDVFVSAAAPEMNALRKAAKHALLEIGARPLEQPDLSLHYGPLHGVLSQSIGRCVALVHLVGFQYGQEPEERILHAPRRSFTHYEIDVAQKLGIPVLSFIATRECPRLGFKEEDAEAKELQGQLRGRLLKDESQHQTFSSPEDLSRQIRALRTRLVVRRSLARLPSRPLGARFIGRARLLEELRAGMTPGSLHLLQPVQSLQSLGGAGTSTLAVELAWRLHDDRKLDFVFWLPAGLRADFEAALASLARTDSLALLPDEIASHRARLQAVLAWFQRPEHVGHFLVIVDGVDSEAAWWSFRSFLPIFAGGAVILTGRTPTTTGLLLHSVAPFSQEQTREFFACRLGLTPSALAQEGPAIDRLAEVLGRVPLALTLAAGHLAESRQTPRQFLAALAGVHATLDLGTLFERSVAALDETTRSLLRQLCCLAPEPAAIPLAMFEQRGDWPLTSVAFATLERRGLVQRDESTRTVRLHRTVRETARDGLLSAQHITDALGILRPALEVALLKAAGSSESANPGLRELLIPHCRALLGQLNGHPLEIHATALSRGLSDWLSECGRPAEAEVFSRRALAIDERRLGPTHLEIGSRLRELAGLLRALRRLPEAEVLYRRALAIDEAKAGPHSPETAANLYQLATCLRAADRLAEAETLSRRALAIEERHYGADHPKVAMAIHRLAGLLEARRRLGETEILYRRAFLIDEVSLGSLHPRLTVRLHHLGRLLGELGQHEEAAALFARALALEEQKLGPEHLELAPVLTEYAVLMEEMGRESEASQAYQRALRLNERFLGADHPETALAQANLGAFWHAAGRSAAACPLHEAALATLLRQRGLGRGPHPHLRSVFRHYTETLRALGRPEEEIEALTAVYFVPVPRRVRSRLWDDPSAESEGERPYSGQP